MDDFRLPAHTFLNTIVRAPEAALADLVDQHVSDDCQWDVSHPINTLRGPNQVLDGFFRPLRQAFTRLQRRDEIFIGGSNRRDVGGRWVASVTHYLGNFDAPFLRLPPSNHLVLLRAGEFYRIEDGKITMARIILDIPDLMRQAGYSPFPFSYGLETLFPGPATHDGVLPTGGIELGEQSLDIIEGMLADLHKFDPTTFSSTNQTGAHGYWNEDMLWYGPGGIGSNYLWEGFVKDHREGFLRAFPDRKGGNHFCRIGDGDYAAISGWPSMTMTFQGDYLGVKGDGRPLTLRVMDFYRCADGKIMENWVMLDYTELMAQMGVDIIGQAKAAAAA
ncbi:MAG: ester cyclase [Devosiaceae bacterium]|nr:ester cyclase [Devosiaceae bacterium MH13]